MTSLSELLEAIRGIDTKEKVTDKFSKHYGEIKYTFEGLSYELTTQNELGVPVNDKEFLVLAPFGQWDKKELKAGSSPLEEAFKTVLREGAIAAVKSKLETVYIDITTLEGEVGQFFQDGSSSSNSVAKTIIDVVNGELKDVPTVIRILVGCFNKKVIQDELKTFQQIFWEDSSADAKPLIRNENASLHVGYYGPNFEIP
jgi:hypothetical protein